MAQFSDLKFKAHPTIPNSRVGRIEFENGFGASVVTGEFVNGGEDGLYELAVIGKDGHLCYTTPITNDVIGYLTENQISHYLTLIENLEE